MVAAFQRVLVPLFTFIWWNRLWYEQPNPLYSRRAFVVWDWDDGELEWLERKAKEKPDEYVAHSQSLGTMDINGVEIVYGCTCDLARKYEQFIIDHARQIAEYLNKRAARLREMAAETEIKA